MLYPAIIGIGHYFPERVLENSHFHESLGVSEPWILERTGIRRRRIAGDQEATSDLIVPAALACLQLAGRNADDVDAIIVATVTPDHFFPSTAAIVQARIGARRAWAFDLSASSAGFVYGLALARALVLSRDAKSVLVCGADKMSSIANKTDAATAILFGDGAGVALVEEAQTDGVGIIDCALRSDGAGAPFLRLPAGGSRKPPTVETVLTQEHYLVQDGAAVFRSAVSMMSDLCTAVMFRNNLQAAQIDWLVPHQANRRIMDAVATHLGVPPNRTMSNIEEVGNTWAASIPACLSQWHQSGHLDYGQRILLTSFGAGYCAGAAYLRWAIPR
jgi:3-oxoacyl-[acyl-carrier-protein] synthase-3